MNKEIGFIPIVEFTGNVGCFAGFDFTLLPTERIPYTGCPPVAVNRSFNLVGSGGGSPDKVGAEIMAVERWKADWRERGVRHYVTWLAGA